MDIPVSFTWRALEEIRRIKSQKNIPEGYGLRVGAEGGGCSGYSYILGFDKKKEKDDYYDLEGIQVFIEKRHGMFVLGMEIDFAETEEGMGFVFNAQK